MQDMSESNKVDKQALSTDERNWALLIHISTLSGFIIPFGNIIAPIILWHMKKEESAFIGMHGREAINFQISMTIYILVSIILIFVLIGILALIVLGIFDLIVTVIAALHASDGKEYRYPLSITFLK